MTLRNRRAAHLTRPLPSSVTIPVHATSVILQLTTVQDQVDEPDGTVTVTIEPSSAYKVSPTDSAATITVRDDDLPTVSIKLADPANPTVTEGTPLRFLVERDTAHASSLAQPMDVDFTVKDVPRGIHLTQPVLGRVTIPAHATSVVLGLTTVQDFIDELNGTVTVSIATSTAYMVSTTAGAATMMVEDDDILPDTPAGLEANGNIVSNLVTLWWEHTRHATGYEVRYSPEVCVDQGDMTACAPDPTAWERETISDHSSTSLQLEVDSDVDKKKLYRVEVRGVSPVGTSDWSDPTFVYPTDGPPTVSRPLFSLLPKQSDPPRIASAPMYGHQKNGVWEYSICAGTIPSTFTSIGAADLERAVNKWSSAAPENSSGGQLLTATRVYPSKPDCKPQLIPYHPTHGKDEIMFVSRDALRKAGCKDAPACWRTDTWVDVLFESYTILMRGLPKIRPGDVLLWEGKTNWESPAYHLSPCTLVEHMVVHEAGHAFGIGWPLGDRSDKQFLNEHPENTEHSVMSYGIQKYCEPRAYDVAAMRVNYQSR